MVFGVWGTILYGTPGGLAVADEGRTFTNLSPGAGRGGRSVSAMSAAEVRDPTLWRPVEDDAPALRVGPLEVHPAEYQVMVGGVRAGLTVREFQTFWVLAQRPDRVLTRGSIYALVWGGAMAPRDRSVDVFVRKVRRKLADVSPEWLYIHTHFGIGYRFSPERPDDAG